MSRARTMIYPDGENVALNYNNQGLLSTLGSYVSGSNYNQASQLTSLALGNNAVTSYTYNPQNLRLTNLTTSNNLQNLGYQYDNVGNVTQIIDNVRGETSQFTYDDLNRLKTAGITNVYSQEWNYDPIGSIQWRKDNGVQTNYAYADPAHKHAATSMGGNTYSYDANGNMTNHAGDTLSFDAENRLTLATNSGTSYTYNGDGARVKKVVGGTTTYYVGNYLEVSVTGGVTTTTKYYYFGAQRVAFTLRHLQFAIRAFL